MSELTDEIKQRIARHTGLTPEKLDVILSGMVETKGIAARCKRQGDERMAAAWDFYLGGSQEVLVNAGASSFDVEQLVAVMYSEYQEERYGQIP